MILDVFLMEEYRCFGDYFIIQYIILLYIIIILYNIFKLIKNSLESDNI